MAFSNQLLGEVVATDVSLNEYMTHYAELNCEWIDGVVIRVSPSELKHNNLIHYLYQLLDGYFELKPIGTVIGQPFVMRLPKFPKRRREPDLLVILNTNPNELKNTYMDGPADLCVEVVSEESTSRDHGEKFQEYEKGGVSEYWIVDYRRQESRFYCLSTEGIYERQELTSDGQYQTPLLPQFSLDVAIMWNNKLPGTITISKMIQTMLSQ